MPPQHISGTFSNEIVYVDDGIFVLSTMLLLALDNIIRFPLLVILVQFHWRLSKKNLQHPVFVRYRCEVALLSFDWSVNICAMMCISNYVNVYNATINVAQMHILYVYQFHFSPFRFFFYFLPAFILSFSVHSISWFENYHSFQFFINLFPG